MVIGNTSSINLADLSQFLVGSDTLKLTPFFIRNFTIPSVALTHPSMMTRSGVALHVAADSMDFNELTLDVMLDENFNTYFELLDIVFSEVDFFRDTFESPSFDLWVQVMDQDKKTLFRVDFKNCRIASLGELSLDPGAELGASISISIVYDYWYYTRPEKCNLKNKFINGDSLRSDQSKKSKKQDNSDNLGFYESDFYDISDQQDQTDQTDQQGEESCIKCITTPNRWLSIK